MWSFIASKILRNKVLILILLGIITVIMAYHARFVEMTYEIAKLLPSNDSTYIKYENFREKFGEDGNVLVIGIEQNLFDNLEQFNAWYDLGNRLKTIDGIDTIFSIADVYNVKKNMKEKKFELIPIIQTKPTTQLELDSIRSIIYSLPFYKGLLYNDSSDASLMAITLNSKIFCSKARIKLLNVILDEVEQFMQKTKLDVHFSGLPFIRTKISGMLQSELKMFIALAILVTVIILFAFFRSFKVVIVSMSVVAIGVIWSLGMMGLLSYNITILTALIPPLLIVIGVPNCIFLLNKYHNEYKNHGNKVKALARVIHKIGNATFMTNATTAVGFATFIFIDSPTLQEFGVIASISIMLVFVLSLLIIPIFFSFLSPPKYRHLKHLENKTMNKFIDILVYVVTYHRKMTYVFATLLVFICIYGITKMKITGNIVDDIPKKHIVYKDLKFFEKHFKGIMPFEVVIDTKKPNYATKGSTIKKIDQLQKIIATYPEFSRPLSIVEAIKFSKQAYYNGNPDKYQLINDREKIFFKVYIDNAKSSESVLHAFLDSTKQITRISVQMADIGTIQMNKLICNIRPRIDSIFTPDKYKVDLTGTSIVFLKATSYLIENLFKSLLFAIIIISFLMALLFSSVRMVGVSLIPNVIPLLFTAALMGYFGIPLKPSTILVFSIAFGISVDNAIHLLAKYRQELKLRDWNIKEAIIPALKETGISMTYTSVVLFFGFSMFTASEFGGTMALGLLISVTLFIAMLCNLILLPSLLLSLDKIITTRAFKEPLLEIFDEEEDIELDQLTIQPTAKEKEVAV